MFVTPSMLLCPRIIFGLPFSLWPGSHSHNSTVLPAKVQSCTCLTTSANEALLCAGPWLCLVVFLHWGPRPMNPLPWGIIWLTVTAPLFPSWSPSHQRPRLAVHAMSHQQYVNTTDTSPPATHEPTRLQPTTLHAEHTSSLYICKRTCLARGGRGILSGPHPRCKYQTVFAGLLKRCLALENNEYKTID